MPNSRVTRKNVKHLSTRRRVLKGAAALGALSLLGRMDCAFGRDHKRPNILFLLADDLRYDGVGYLNKVVRTPNLDRLAKDGVRFHNAFVTTSICCASRASIFTGTYTRRHGVWDFETRLPPSLLKSSYPVLLRNAGYRTGFFGKYGVGDLTTEIRAGFDAIEDRGFAYYLPGDTKKEYHSNQQLADQGEQFIRSTPATQPFCLSISFNAPHSAGDDDLPAEPDMLALYANDIFTRGPLMNEAAFQTVPDFIGASGARQWWQRSLSSDSRWLSYVRKYYALITGADRALGRILTVLDYVGRTPNTIIIFASDNGFFLGDYGLHGKWFGYESSIHIPLVIRPLERPAIQDVQATVLNIDFAPTMLALAGVPIPPTMQGRNLCPLWTGARPRSPWRTDFLYEHDLRKLGNQDPAEVERYIPSSEGVRNERYTYLRYPRESGRTSNFSIVSPIPTSSRTSSAAPRRN